MEAKSHRRERLAELLWPKGSPTEARHSLATALSTLRPRLGPEGLESSRDHARLTPGRVNLDLDLLEAGDILGNEISGPLEVTAFLDGFDIADSSEFTHWKDGQQARLLPAIKDALVVLIDQCRRTGDSRQIERLADRMLALDDLSEEAIRAKMEARAFAGDRLTALEIYEKWRKQLAEELQAAPSGLVEGMAVRLRRRGWERTTLTNIPNVPTDQWRGRPFIGRTAEYRVLYEAWEAVKRGEPGHALVLGDSGVGKTTLVEKLTTAAGLEGAAISRVQCYDLEREIPYSTVCGLVLGLLDRPGVSGTPGEAIAELARTVPEVRHRFPSIPAPTDSQGETARIRLTEAFLEMLTAVAEEHPVILVVDDLHLADDVSLAVLHLMMRRARGRPIMVVFLARPGELVQDSQAARLRASNSSLGICEIQVSPLSDSESRDMLLSLVQPDEPQPGVADQRALLRAGAGYPMVLELLVEDWKVSREQTLALAIGGMTAELGDAGPAQAAYRQILDRITRSLHNTTHNVSNLAAILGPRLNDLSMYALVDLSAGQTMSAMADLVARRVLRDGANGLEFVNELVRAAAYVGVSPTLRRVLHSKIADRFMQDCNNGEDDLSLEIAWHCMRGGRTEEATHFLLRGARQALCKGAVHSAEQALSTAIPHLANSERDQATLLLAETLQEQGRWLDSLTLLNEEGMQERSEVAPIMAVVAAFHSSPPDTDEAMRNIQRLTEVMDRSSDVRVRVKAAAAAALMLNNLRIVKEAKQLLRCVDRIPATSLGLDDLTSLADSKARLLYHALERGSSLDEIIRVADKLRDTRQVNSKVASLHTGLGVLACSQGQYLEARTEFLRANNMCINLGNDTTHGSQAGQIALCCYRLGEYAEAVQWCMRAAETFGSRFAGYIECQIAQYVGCSHAIQGECKKAFEAIDRLDSRIPRTVPAWMKQAWLIAKADILFLAGQHLDAFAVARQAIGEPYPVLYSDFFAGGFARWLALSTEGTFAEAEARNQIDRMARSLETFDAIDQVEVLCAGTVLGNASGNALSDSSRLIRVKLGYLPPATTQHLTRLGVLSN
ncbi:MAG: AAA family ATPase [Gemmatimonadales bacterium]|nr:AAA family ATPase [Gemmatimonadales bacterium]